MRNSNYRLNESYFNPSDAEDLASDVTASIDNSITSVKNEETYELNKFPNYIIFSYTLKGTKDLKLFCGHMRKWLYSIFYAVDNLDLFDSEEDFYIMARSTDINDCHPLCYHRAQDRLNVVNAHSAEPEKIFNKFIENLKGRNSNTNVFFDIIIGHNFKSQTLKQEAVFYKKIGKLYTFACKRLQTCVVNLIKSFINLSISNQKMISVKTTSSGEQITPQGYKDILMCNYGNDSDSIDAINRMFDKARTDDSNIPDEIARLIPSRNLEYLKNNKASITLDNNVYKVTFGDKNMTVTLNHILNAWYFLRKDYREVEIYIPGTLELKDNLDERKFGNEWWSKYCKVYVNRLRVQSMKFHTFTKIMETMTIESCDLTGLSVGAASRTSYKYDKTDWKNQNVELFSKTHDIVFDNGKIVFVRK